MLYLFIFLIFICGVLTNEVVRNFVRELKDRRVPKVDLDARLKGYYRDFREGL